MKIWNVILVVRCEKWQQLQHREARQQIFNVDIGTETFAKEVDANAFAVKLLAQGPSVGTQWKDYGTVVAATVHMHESELHE